MLESDLVKGILVPPTEFTDEEKRRWEIIEAHLKARDMIRPEWKRIATWATAVSMVTTVATIGFSFATNSLQSAKSELELARKQKDLDEERSRVAGALRTAAEKKTAAEDGQRRVLEQERRLSSQYAVVAAVLVANQSRKEKLETLAAEARAGKVTTLASDLEEMERDLASSAKDDAKLLEALNGAPASGAVKLMAEPRRAIGMLFSTDDITRADAFGAIVAASLGSYEVMHDLVEYVNLHTDNAQGMSSALEVMRLMRGSSFARLSPAVESLVDKVAASDSKTLWDPQVRRRLKLIRDRIHRAESERRAAAGGASSVPRP